ncbi:MAG: hypothetical protein V3W37_02440 [Candidatus Binatia bacterium]
MNTNTKDAVKETVEAQLKVRTVDLKGKGFPKLYRKILTLRRALFDIENALPEDVDKSIEFLADYVIEPTNRGDVLEILWNTSAEELSFLFSAIMGRDEASPQAKSGDSVTISD